MEAKYDFLPLPFGKGETDEPVFYPKLISNGTVTFRQLAEDIANASSFKESTVIGVMEEIEKWTTFHLSHGFRVQIGTMGSASLTLKAKRDVNAPDEIHAQSILFDKVKFNVSKKFSKMCSGPLVRAEKSRKFRQSSQKHSEEERFGMLSEYLQTHSFITRNEYAELTGLQKTSSWRDLDKWVKEGKIKTKGRAPHRVYTH